ncbi:DAO-2 protein [Dirofilaria immitis]|nr:DAO-2 protein [Dirofilaria immitis]
MILPNLMKIKKCKIAHVLTIQQQQRFPHYFYSLLENFSTGIEDITIQPSLNFQSLLLENTANHQQKSLIPNAIRDIIEQIKSDQLFPPWKPYQLINPPLSNAEKRLKKCCSRLNNADSECKKRFCSFDALKPQTVLYYLAICQLRGPTVGQMWDCASSKQNHTNCCIKRAYYHFVKFIAKQLMEFQRITIRDCFREHLETHHNLYGDW